MTSFATKTKSLTAALVLAGILPQVALADTEKPNILVIMADDVGWNSLSSYHQGVQSIQTPNLDLLASQGARMTDYYAQPNCPLGGLPF